MVMDPATLLDGTRESHGKYVWKYHPVLYSHITDPTIHDKHSRKRNSTICNLATENKIHMIYYMSLRNKTYFIRITRLYLYYPDYEKVEQSVNIRSLKFRFTGVLHEFRVLAGENYHSVTPFCVSQDTAS